MKVHYPKLYNMAHLLALYFLLLPKDLTIIFISHVAAHFSSKQQKVLSDFSEAQLIKTKLLFFA